MRLWPCLCRADGQYHRGRCVNTLVGLVCVSAWVDCVHPLQRAFPLCSLHTVPSAATRCRPHMPPPGVEAATLPSGMRGALVPAHACSHRGKDWCPPFLQPHFCLHRTEAVPRTGALTPQGACVCVCAGPGGGCGGLWDACARHAGHAGATAARVHAAGPGAAAGECA